MNKIIGICGFEREKYIGVPSKYAESIQKAGGIPIIFYDADELIDEYINIADGIMFVGGGDIEAHYFGQKLHEKANGIDCKRDSFEINICRTAYNRKIPILGICRGCQVINIALGGDINQDIPNHMKQLPCDTHAINIAKDSIIYKAFENQRAEVNSYHHQSCNRLAQCLYATAFSDDGIIEAFECNDSYIHGVQFHPERKTENECFLKLFYDFIDCC